MYYILDKDLKPCGVLSLDGKGCKFYGDDRNVQIADDTGKLWNDTLTLSVPYGYPETDYMTEGYHLLKQGDNGRWYCFRINNWTDGTIGPVHFKTIQAVNLCIWDLAHTQVVPTTLTKANSTQAFEHNLQKSDWQIGTDNFYGGGYDVEFTLGDNAQSMTDTLTKTYSVEIDAYVELQNGQVAKKLIDIEPQLGEVTGRRIEYRRNMTGITRSGSDDQLFTKLYVYGGTPDGADSPISIASVNSGQDFLVDDDANDTYNAGKKYLEGFTQNEDITDPAGLLTWGKQQLALYNHPKYNYTVDVAYLGWNPNLGDTIEVLDFEMQPPLTLSARVIQKVESEANPQSNQVVIGEFVEIIAVTPSDIWKLQAAASQAQQSAEQAKSYRIEIFMPDGTDFSDGSSQKRIIARVFLGKDNVTALISPDSFAWQKINSDGSHDLDWEAAHTGVGNVITVGDEISGSTIRCNLINGKGDPILSADETDAAYFATLPLTNSSDDVNKRVSQYAQVDSVNGDIYWSQEYTGPKQSENGGWQSFNLTRTDLDGNYKDQMWVIAGGHGTSFGIEHVGTDIYIWSAYLDTTKSTLNGAHYWGVARFKYVPGKTLLFGDSSTDFQSLDGTYYRVNYDEKNDYVQLSSGFANFYVCKRSDIEQNLFKPIYIGAASDCGFDGNSQTFQTSCLDFPYIYFCSGDVDGHDQRIMYCYDIQSRSPVYKIVFTFDKETINQIGDYNEPEAVSVYYDETGKKWVIIGFSWGNEDSSDYQRTNQLFRINEHNRDESTYYFIQNDQITTGF
ncbi:phage tail protein [Pullulanibacillus sp. KACC 23026]|uniref:phage tail spike protein n=1 Tax=Pullulanibacillus sp. KACC 23026 TaxID=3028315 RepID=UPI0023B080A3|nr:phage tail spike protein [Pullulanibacillus sp. KACC 23026]WEG14159.1 phage tail protein [Pullulanibacillus sp. KACC 23026]